MLHKCDGCSDGCSMITALNSSERGSNPPSGPYPPHILPAATMENTQCSTTTRASFCASFCNLAKKPRSPKHCPQAAKQAGGHTAACRGLRWRGPHPTTPGLVTVW